MAQTGKPTECTLGDGLKIKRMVSGLWQVSGGHGEIETESALAGMRSLYDAGLTSFDMADHYGPAELLAGEFYQSLDEGSRAQMFTKWCPPAGAVDAGAVKIAVDRALSRMKRQSIDLLQLHWWDYLHPGYLDAIRELGRLQDAGTLRNIGVTNFDTAHLRIIRSTGVPVVSNQVHYSLLDRRAGEDMADYCAEYDVKLLCYGTLAGGFLSERWIGKPDPTEKEISTNWSLMKYLRFIRIFGGWDLFQQLLQVLQDIAGKHEVSISNVAVRWVLDRPAVGAVLVGARLGLSDHTEENLRVFSFALDAEDNRAIDEVLARARPIPGDCGDEYRKPPFLTASGDLSHHETTNDAAAVSPRDSSGALPRTTFSSGTKWEKMASYSRSHRAGNRIAVSGTTATYNDEVVAPGDASAQTHFCIDKIEAALRALGGTIDDVLRTRIYVPNIRVDWEPVARAHGQRFAGIDPANSLVGAELVGEEYLVEMEADAIVGETDPI